jgi:acyl carrier protein
MRIPTVREATGSTTCYHGREMALPSSRINIGNAIREIIGSVADVPLEAVPTSGPFFEEVGLDSMMVVGIAVEIQERFGIELPRTKAEMIALNSIDGMTHYVSNALQQGTVDEPA